LANQTSTTVGGVVVSEKTHAIGNLVHPHRSGKERAGEQHAFVDAPKDMKEPETLPPSNKPTAEDEYGFTHPAISRPQRTVWLPKDQLGLADEEIAANKEMGVDSSHKDAHMNEKGKVDISGPPPDEVVEN
jgi:calcium permeable stress-gated cation channel